MYRRGRLVAYWKLFVFGMNLLETIKGDAILMMKVA